jgi:preprotein translocase subunit SecF
MKRVIQFSKARNFFFAFSGLLLLIGIAGYIVNHGFNLGVDFQAGISFQFQIAPASFTVQYTGPDKVQISIPAGEQAITSPGDIIFTVTSAKDGSRQSHPFAYKSYATVRELADAIAQSVPGVSVQVVGDAAARPTDLLPLTRPADITGTTVSVNLSPAAGRGVTATLPEVRSLLEGLDQSFTLQAVGAAGSQEFISRIPVKAGTNESTFQQDTEATLLKALEGKYGTGQVILKSSEFVGARMAQSLASQTIWLVIIALALILIYMMIRFHPWYFAVAAVLGIMHDALVMLSFDAVFKIEIDAGTIAAILTILGYSINDTIVNFDRARENIGLMRGASMTSILDTSVTQTLSRTFITSGATLLTVVALYVLTSGTIKNFALNMIVGIVEGTYSTFISAFFVIVWVKARDKKRKQDASDKFAVPGADVNGNLIAAEAPVAEEGAAGAEDAEVVAPVAGGLAIETAGAAPQQAPAASPASPQPFLGQSGSRKQKKHKRRHH